MVLMCGCSPLLLGGCQVTFAYHTHDHDHQEFTTTIPEVVKASKEMFDASEDSDPAVGQNPMDQRVQDEHRSGRVMSDIFPD